MFTYEEIESKELPNVKYFLIRLAREEENITDKFNTIDDVKIAIGGIWKPYLLYSAEVLDKLLF